MLMGYIWTFSGYAVLLVNYRGSLGSGEAGVRSLPGRVGVQDVKDCYDALLHVLKSEDFPIDKEKLFLYGGSHGGFLVTHLAGQYPVSATYYQFLLFLGPWSCISLLYLYKWLYLERNFIKYKLV